MNDPAVKENEVMTDHRRTIDRLRLVNFTAFRDLEIEFSPGINAIIGENATGKTHLLKALYTMHDCGSLGLNPFELISDLYLYDKKNNADPLNWEDINELANRRGGRNWAIKVQVGDEVNWIRTTPIDELTDEALGIPDSKDFKQFVGKINTVFIPEKNLLPHAKGLRSVKKKFNIQFDSSDMDVLDSAFLVPYENLSQQSMDLLADIGRVIGGQLTTSRDDEVSVDHQDYNLRLIYEAEGHSKFALLWLLIRNGELQPGSILLWDEPEANLNPKLMKEVVRILLVLEQMGIQIFFATHDYVMLKWLDLLAEEKHHVRYHALYRDEHADIRCESAPELTSLQQNAILDVYEDLYNTELERTIDRIGDD